MLLWKFVSNTLSCSRIQVYRDDLCKCWGYKLRLWREQISFLAPLPTRL